MLSVNQPIPSDKHNSLMTKATGFISSLLNITLYRGVPFCQPQQLQCLHHGSTKPYQQLQCLHRGVILLYLYAKDAELISNWLLA